MLRKLDIYIRKAKTKSINDFKITFKWPFYYTFVKLGIEKPVIDHNGEANCFEKDITTDLAILKLV